MEEQNIEKGSNKTLIITGIVVALLVVGLITNGFGLLTGGVIQTSQLEIGNSPVLGNANAPVTIYEFSDFSCPYCAAAEGYNQPVISSLKARDSSWEAPFPKIVEEYVNTGKVKIVFKYSPGHGTGVPAHLIALALQEQNLFWKFHEEAFANQQD